MRRLKLVVFGLGIVIGLLGGVLPGARGPVAAQERISEFGRYQGYSEPIYDGYVRTSQYVAVRDGVRLAVDLYRPTRDGVVATEPLPAIWTHTRYQRAQRLPDGTLIASFGSVGALLPYGYVIAVVDSRGSGASFGVRPVDFSPEEAQDAYDITEWLAAQPWCTGKVGMFGRSYLGITQLFAASQAPPSLRAIFPEMHMFDVYDLVYQNGIFLLDFLENWDRLTRMLDNSSMYPVAPVDEDPDGILLAEALALRPQNVYPLALMQTARFRDSPLLADEQHTGFATISPDTHLDQINASGIAIYQIGGWFDMYTTDPLLWHANLTVPRKVVMPDWDHSGYAEWLPVEQHRWFDYWLKGIDNGIMDEPPVRYAVNGTLEWRTAETWPLPEEQRTAYYFQPGPSGSVASANDGLLGIEQPATAGQDVYTVDYTTTLGNANRFTRGYGGEYGYPDLTFHDEHALTYTTLPLEAGLEVTGHPVVHLWVTSTADDGDFFVTLEEIARGNRAVYITEGKLRASYRALGEPPYDNLGLPWHPSREADITPLPAGEPVELVFDLKPTSNVFEAGHRLRITVAGADADMFETPRLDPPPQVTIGLGGEHASYIELPVIPAE